jgi:hypothetical protein
MMIFGKFVNIKLNSDVTDMYTFFQNIFFETHFWLIYLLSAGRSYFFEQKKSSQEKHTTIYIYKQVKLET